MHKIMAELHHDHVHLARLLSMMDKQVSLLASGGDPDLYLLIDIVHYIQNYPDLVHHPKEDQVYRVFKQRADDQYQDIVDKLMQEHRSLPLETVEFLTVLQAAANGSSLFSLDELIDKIKHFIAHQRRHMQQEENRLFPMIDKTLTEQDWAVIEKEMDFTKDPLFGAEVEALYDNLYQLIQSESDSDQPE